MATARRVLAAVCATLLLVLLCSQLDTAACKSNSSSKPECSSTQLCPNNQCCNNYGQCGSTEAYCHKGCLSQCGDGKGKPKGGGNGSHCFPGDAIVRLAGGRTKRMRELGVGDEVAVWSSKTGTIVYDPVYAFGHKDPDAEAEFVTIHAGAGSTLHLTAHHFLPTASASATGSAGPALVFKRAGDVKVGDLVWAGAGNGTAPSLTKVSGTSSTVRQGLYNPLTMSGTIVVDGVVASVHSDWFLDPLFDLLRVPHHLPVAYQAVLAPVRLLYNVLGKQAYESAYSALNSRIDLASFGSQHGGTVFTLLVVLALSATFISSSK